MDSETGVTDEPALEAVSAADDTADDNGEQQVELSEILYQYRHAILDLAARVSALEARPQFAAAIGKRTRL